jgi:hypothetical protein
MTQKPQRTDQRKLCTVCGADISSRKRIKDRHGNYYCEPCWAAALSGGAAGSDMLAAKAPAQESRSDAIVSEMAKDIADAVSPPNPLDQLKRSWEYMWKPEMAFGGFALAGAVGFLLPMLLFDESTGAARIVAIIWMCLGGAVGAVCCLAIPYYLVRRTAAAFGIARYFDLSVPEMWAASTLVPGLGLLTVFVLDSKAQKELKESGALAPGNGRTAT